MRLGWEQGAVVAWCGVPPGLSSLNHVRVGGALQVYCWLVDRLGGGWTLGIVNAYRWCHPNQGNSPTGNVDRNVLGTVNPFLLAAFGLCQ